MWGWIEGLTIGPSLSQHSSPSFSQLRRLAGGSRLRGKEKDLRNVIEINEEEVKEGIKVYQKYHTDDSLNKLYQPDLVSTQSPCYT